ncbi:MAG: EF-P lysine aminoacylase GenX [Kiritimatiellae bacterium]|nr:EF-P lysine aminoacylase GenX [Kiritimatiellia bacterium]
MKNILEARAGVLKAVRAYFDGLDFVEVETPVRICAPAPEEYIDCPECNGMFLRASPELQMKKLLAAGMEKIYQIGPCFREAEKGSRHNPEFTMLEWYRKDKNYLAIKEDMIRLWSLLSGSNIMPTTITVRQAYLDFALWDPWTNWDRERFDFDMANIIEPKLSSIGGAIFLTDYPVQASSLAKINNNVAERWEFYYDGLELANAFSELCDKVEQSQRFKKSRDFRLQQGEADYPIDEEFLSILPSIRVAAGAALGVDRLVMALTGIKSISAVRARM